MCGIGGILRIWPAERRELALRTPHDQSIPETWLDILDDAVRYRGPDGHARFRDRAVRVDGSVVDIAFVHRRLSILDPAGGHQPMVWRSGVGVIAPDQAARHSAGVLAGESSFVQSDGRPQASRGFHIAVVFNGCIYNHRDLRQELQKSGHAFATDHSDTEVLIHGWREWETKGRDYVGIHGDSSPHVRGLWYQLDGMFAAAVWDGQHGTLALARDPCGEKPLYLLDGADAAPGVHAFSSSAAGLTSLARILGLPIALAPKPRDGLDHPLATWIRYGFAESPPLQHIKELDPRENVYLPMSPFGTTSQSGGRIPWVNDGPLTPDRVDALLASAVESRLESDVPLGCFLSGGVDSSLIAHYAKRRLGSLQTFTVRMPDARYDESAFAETVARHLGVSHTTLDCDASASEDLEGLITRLGLPFGDSSILPALWVSRATKKHVGVALTGDGGDELFGGYDRYSAAKLLRRARWLIAPLSLLISDAGPPKGRRSRAARLASAAAHGGYDDLLSIFPTPDYRNIAGPSLGEPPQLCFRFWGSTIWRLREDQGSYLPYDLLRKADTATMSVALEGRAPFLARDVLSHLERASLRTLMPGGREGGRKGLLRQVARKYLPAEIVDRPKMGFAIPIGEWFRSDYGGLRTMLLDHLNSTEPFGPLSLGIDLNMKFIRQMLDEHLGTGPSGRVTRDHSQRLYMLLVLSIWAKWLGGLQGASRVSER